MLIDIKFNMVDDDYNFIYGLVDELRKNISRNIVQKAQKENEVSFSARCNIGAVIRLFKVYINKTILA